MAFSEEACEWLAKSIGTPHRSFSVTKLKGSTSSSVYCITSTHGSIPERYVLRVIDNREWLAEEPDLAEHEGAALQEAQRAGLRAPRLISYSAKDVDFGAPVVLMSYLEGNVELCPSDLRPWLSGMAEKLALTHKHRADGLAWSYQSWIAKENLAPPAWTANPTVWERAIEMVLHPARDFPPVFIHRDYHPANILWHHGEISGVVDWINGCRGPAGVDVATCRINLAQMFGVAVADQFLDAYIECEPGFDYDPYWDIDSILDSNLPQPIFHHPWQEFGMSVITPEVLRSRVDDYLASVMSRI